MVIFTGLLGLNGAGNPLSFMMLQDSEFDEEKIIFDVKTFIIRTSTLVLFHRS